MQDWHVKLQTPHGWDNPYLVEEYGSPFLDAQLPDHDLVTVTHTEVGPAGQISVQLVTGHGNWWRAIEVYEIKAIRLEHEGDATPGLLHRPEEIHAMNLLQTAESEYESLSEIVHATPNNLVFVFRKAKAAGVRTVMYVARADRLGFETGRFYGLCWKDT